MTTKPVVTLPRAVRDVQAAIAYYADEAGERVATGLVGALDNAYRAIAAHPAAGSPRYGHDLNLPGLRGVSLKRYPYLVFYVERAEHIEVWRVLHAQRDIPASMQGG